MRIKDLVQLSLILVYYKNSALQSVLFNFKMFPVTMDWTDVEVRRRFEEAISRWRQRRQGWTLGQTVGWAAALFGLNLVIVTLLYGGLACKPACVGRGHLDLQDHAPTSW